MKTFLARRYYRALHQVSGLEKALGIFLVLLIVAITTGFVVHSRGDHDYLFNLDEEILSRRPMDHHVIVAGLMLGELGIPGWKAPSDAQALSLDENASAITAVIPEAEAFDVGYVYRREYETIKEPRSTLAVWICDAETPERAFGLCHARRPSGHESINIGKDGWAIEHSRAGFWNGRYYTELKVSPRPEGDSTTLATLARAIASAQLSFGGPFEAEDHLPAEGRQPDSFRYVHRGALGFDALEKVFLVDLENGVTAWTHDAEREAQAKEIFVKLGAADESGSVKHSGPLTIVSVESGVLAACIVGRRVFGAWGPDPKAVEQTALQSFEDAMSRSAAAISMPQRSEPAAQESPFPEPEIGNWRLPNQVARFTPDTLYEKINGRADAYLQFQVVSLTFGTFYDSKNAEQTLDVYWYDMGEPANAMGIFQLEEPPEAEPMPVGQRGYRVGGAIFFSKGSSYVQLLPGGANEGDPDVTSHIATRIAEQIKGGSEDQWAQRLLPQSGRVEGSFQYITEDAFGLEFLSRVYTADYDLDGGRVTLFILRTESASDSTALIGEYAEYFKEFGRLLSDEPTDGRSFLAGEAFGAIDVVFAKGVYAGGVAGAEDAELAERAAQDFYDELQASE